VRGSLGRPGGFARRLQGPTHSQVGAIEESFVPSFLRMGISGCQSINTSGIGMICWGLIAQPFGLSWVEWNQIVRASPGGASADRES
jgi:hypothetical protein